MQGKLVRIPVALAALWIGLLVPALPCAVSPAVADVPCPAAPAAGNDSAAVEGGSVLICALTGMLFGAAIMTGNALAAGGAVVGAIKHGCLW
jgi:hypothetical protein